MRSVSNPRLAMSKAPESPLPTTSAKVEAHQQERARSRPIEIEELSNRFVIHPLSRGLATLLIPTGISANAVSVLGLVMMMAAAAFYFLLDWPWAALVGFCFQFIWHVFDGADGEVARRTGTSSTKGEIVDGICDHLGHLVLYVTVTFVAARTMGPALTWCVALVGGFSRVFQANCYESARRNYRRWVYGVGWIRNKLEHNRTESGMGLWGRFSSFSAHTYLRVSRRVSGDDRELEAALMRLAEGPPEKAARARELYRHRQLALVQLASLLSLNNATLALFVSMLAGSPFYFFLFEAVVMNAVLWFCQRSQTHSYAALLRELTALEQA